MENQNVENYLSKLKTAYNKTTALEKSFNALYKQIESELLNTKNSKPGLVTKSAGNIIDKITPHLDRSFMLSLNQIDKFLNDFETIYNNALFYTKRANAKFVSQKSATILHKFANMLEELYTIVCNRYDITEDDITKDYANLENNK